jgi:thiol:disulfide interchange protein DsbC
VSPITHWALILSVLLSSGAVAWAAPASSTADDAQQVLRERLAALWPQAPILRIAPLVEMPLYEVELENMVLYMDPTGRYVFSGALIDLATRQNLTKARLDAQRAARWQEAWRTLPDDWPVRFGGDGREGRRLTVFHDPDCPYCRQLHPELIRLADRGWQIEVLLYPQSRLHPQAREKAISIWCAPAAQRVAVLHAALRGEPVPQVSCAHPIDAIIAFGQRLGIHSTPFLVLNHTRAVAGYHSAEELERLAAAQLRQPASADPVMTAPASVAPTAP